MPSLISSSLLTLYQDGSTPAHEAAKSGEADALAALIAAGANINAVAKVKQ